MMKHFSLLLIGCGLSAWTTEAQYPKIVSIGAEESMPGGGAGRLSSIATDTLNQPHIVCDGGSYAYFYDKIGTSWRASSYNSGTVGSSQYYNPHIEIDSKNRAWVSGVLFGGVVGLGIIVRTDMATAPSSVYFSIVRLQGEWDDGNLSLDPSKPDEMFVSGANGIWKSYVYDASAAGRIRNTSKGQMYAGQGGEKNAFWISKKGSIWHGAIGGWDKWSSSYQNSVRHAAGLSTVTWADFSAYPTQGDDGVYVGLCSDNKNPQIAYMTSAFGGTQGVCVNIWNGTKMVFSSSALLCIDSSGSSGLRRYAPQLAPAKDGGAFICWTRSSRIKIRYIAPDGGTGPEVDVSAGTLGNLCVDAEGNIHVVYNHSGIRYRKINILGSVGYVTTPSDFDNDGQPDLTVFDPNTGKWYIHSTGQQKVIGSGIQWGWTETLPVTGDYDSDGFDDISTYDPQTGNWFFWSMGKGHPLGMYVNFGGPGMIPVPGDYDGDGCSDMAVYQEQTGNWYIWDIVEATSMVWALNWGFPGAKPMPGDYNGDGKTELCVYDSATGNWYIRTINSVYKWAFNWGWAGAVPSSGDFDGDGADDLAIFNPVSGHWFFWAVHKDVPLGQFVQFGGTGFQPVPADYNNDQFCDIAVFDPVLGDWYIWDTLNAKVMLWKKNWGFAGTIPIGSAK